MGDYLVACPGRILRNCTVDDTNIAAERFLARIRDEAVPTKFGPVSVTASIGAITIPSSLLSQGQRWRVV